jgi:hypothetical protein
MQHDDLNAKYKLRNGVAISIRTVMIGALAIVEKHFEKEIAENPERWEKTREEILQRGHDSLEIARNHFNKFCVSFKNFVKDSEGEYENGKPRDFRTRQ